MSRLLRKRPSPATLIALVALFVALGGTAYAITAKPGPAAATPRKIYYRAPEDSKTKTIVHKLGLVLHAKCRGDGSLSPTATSSTGGSFKAWGRDEDTDAEFDSSDYGMVAGDTPLDVLTSDGDVESVGTITWNTRKAQVLTIDLQVE